MINYELEVESRLLFQFRVGYIGGRMWRWGGNSEGQNGEVYPESPSLFMPN
jgi:hypothetical protein